MKNGVNNLEVGIYSISNNMLGVKLYSVNPKDLSDVLGHRGENREWLKTTSPSLRVMADKAVDRGFLRVNGRDLGLIDLSAFGEQI